MYKNKITSLITLLLISFISVFTTSCSDDDDDYVYGTCEVSGVITDSDGNPIKGASVQVLAINAVCTPVKTVTDSEGHYALKMKEAATSLLMMVEAEGYYSSNQTLNDIPYQDGISDVTLGTAKIGVDVVLRKKDN